MKKILTLVLVEKEGRLLLGMKKRGFGEGRWNGFGGKLEPGETITEAAVRELFEEVAVEAKELQQVGELTFSFASDSELVLEVHVFLVHEIFGEPVETEEMKPAWFPYEDIPYRDMWPDDVYWLPLVLKGKKVRCSFHLDAPASTSHTATILSQEIKEVEAF